MKKTNSNLKFVGSGFGTGFEAALVCSSFVSVRLKIIQKFKLSKKILYKPFIRRLALHVESNSLNILKQIKGIWSISWISFETLHYRFLKVLRALGFELIEFDIADP